MNDDKKIDEKQDKNHARQIVLETDGNSVKVIKAETAGTFEFIGILESIINQLKK